MSSMNFEILLFAFLGIKIVNLNLKIVNFTIRIVNLNLFGS